jgi:hypothetical protein
MLQMYVYVWFSELNVWVKILCACIMCVYVLCVYVCVYTHIYT